MKKFRNALLLAAALALGLSFALRAADPVPDGAVKKSYPTGELMSEYSYLYGKLDGLSLDYYKNGQVMYEWNYRRGKLHGVSRAYSMKGKLMASWSYKNGVLHGKSVEYHDNGKKKSYVVYRQGQKVFIKTFNEKGKLLQKEDRRKLPAPTAG
ncbi:MAG TPA: hypothetical protein P5079_07925 [Elusimicrobiota bacterium]|nr:hypothetical protein [Elusimicrobiota bacterium]